MEKMDESERMHHHAEEMKEKKDQRRGPFWRTIHHSWLFWLFVIMILFAVIYYTVSDNFALAPSNQVGQPSQNNRVP